MNSTLTTLAAGAGNAVEIVLWLSCLILAGMGGIQVLLWLRRRLRVEKNGPASVGFSPEELRELHQRGQLTDEEFGRLRKAALGLGGGKDEQPGSPLTDSASNDDGDKAHPGASDSSRHPEQEQE